MTSSIIYIPIIAILVSTISCRRNDCKQHPQPYQLVAPIKLSPGNQTYLVGDTISIVVDLNDNFQCLSGNNPHLHRLVDQDLQMWFSISRLDTLWEYSDYHDFSFGETSGELHFLVKQDYFISLIDHVYSNGIYFSSFYFIPNIRGDYILYFGSDADGHAEFISFEGKCPVRDTNFEFALHSGIDDDNFYLKDSLDIAEGVFDELYLGNFSNYDNFTMSGGFFFRVR